MNTTKISTNQAKALRIAEIMTGTPVVSIDFAPNGPIVHHHTSRPTGNVVGRAFTTDTTGCTACEATR
jgi:hypothetical protein